MAYTELFIRSLPEYRFICLLGGVFDVMLSKKENNTSCKNQICIIITSVELHVHIEKTDGKVKIFWNWGRKDSSVLALHVTNQGWIPGIWSGPQESPGVIPECSHLLEWYQFKRDGNDQGCNSCPELVLHVRGHGFNPHHPKNKKKEGKEWKLLISHPTLSFIFSSKK